MASDKNFIIFHYILTFFIKKILISQKIIFNTLNLTYFVKLDVIKCDSRYRFQHPKINKDHLV